MIKILDIIKYLRFFFDSMKIKLLLFLEKHFKKKKYLIQ